MANYIIIARHGPQETVGDQRLTSYGRRLSYDLSKNLIRTTSQGNATVLSSPLARATETAQFIAGEYHTGVIVDNRLDINATDEDIMSLINEYANTTEILILVTHLECTSKLIDYVSVVTRIEPHRHSLDRASAIVFNIGAGITDMIERSDIPKE